MRVAVLVVLFAAVCVLGDGDAAVASVKDVNLEEIDKVDSSLFNDEQPVKSTPLEQAAAAVVSARDADLDQDTETVVSLAAESAGTSGEDQTMYSFRAMRQATAVAGSSVSEKSSETHAAAMRILNHERSVTAEDMFAEISREQQILVAKKALVSRQKQSIVDSEESLGRLKRLIGENKKILSKNENALRRASDDLLRLISKYQTKLRAGLTKDAAANAASGLGVPMRSRPHQRAAYTKWSERGKREVDTTKSEAALAAANAASKGKAKTAPKKADAKKPAAKAAAKAAPAAAAKAKFAQVHTEATAAAATATATTEEDEAEESTEAAEESEDESEDESESESEDSEEAEEESAEAAEAEAEEETSEEDAAAALFEKDEASYDPSSMDRGAALPGLAPPPHLYNPEDDTFI